MIDKLINRVYNLLYLVYAQLYFLVALEVQRTYQMFSSNFYHTIQDMP